MTYSEKSPRAARCFGPRGIKPGSNASELICRSFAAAMSATDDTDGGAVRPESKLLRELLIIAGVERHYDEFLLHGVDSIRLVSGMRREHFAAMNISIGDELRILGALNQVFFSPPVIIDHEVRMQVVANPKHADQAALEATELEDSDSKSAASRVPGKRKLEYTAQDGPEPAVGDREMHAGAVKCELSVSAQPMTPANKIGISHMFFHL